MKRPIFDPAWPADVKAVYQHDIEQSWDSSIAPHLFNDYNFLIDLYRSEFAESSRPLRVLDVGCAQATLAMLLAEDGHHVVAMDIRQQFLDYAMTRYERGDIACVCGDVFTTEVHESFDLVFVNQVIEHVVRPIELLERVRSWLVPGGRLVVTTPNGRYLRNSLPKFSDLQPIENYLHLEHSADGDGHFFAYDPAELRDIFVSAGFDDVVVRCLGTPWITGHMRIRHLHRLLNRSLLKALNAMLERVPGLGQRFSYQLLVAGRRAG